MENLSQNKYMWQLLKLEPPPDLAEIEFTTKT